MSDSTTPMESTPITFLPLPIHRAIIQRWVRDLEAYRTPEPRPLRFTMRVYDNGKENFDLWATGLFAESSMAHIPRFFWTQIRRSYTLYGSGPEESYDLMEYGLARTDRLIIHESTLPIELRWLLGFSEEEEDRVNQWDLEGLPFTEIAARLRQIYLPEGAEIANEKTAWRIGVENFPVYDSSEEYLREVGKLSAWSGESDGGVEGTERR